MALGECNLNYIVDQKLWGNNISSVIHSHLEYSGSCLAGDFYFEQKCFYSSLFFSNRVIRTDHHPKFISGYYFPACLSKAFYEYTADFKIARLFLFKISNDDLFLKWENRI